MFQSHAVHTFVLKNLPVNHEKHENIIQSNTTISRLRELNNGARAVIAETWFRPEIIVKSDAMLSNHSILATSLLHINMRVLNLKLIDVQEFIKNENAWFDELHVFTEGAPINMVPNDVVLHGNIRKLFSSFQQWNGKSVIERAKNTLDVITALVKVKQHKRDDEFNFKYTTAITTDQFCLNSLERLIGLDRDQQRYNDLTRMSMLTQWDVIQCNLNL